MDTYCIYIYVSLYLRVCSMVLPGNSNWAMGMRTSTHSHTHKHSMCIYLYYIYVCDAEHIYNIWRYMYTYIYIYTSCVIYIYILCIYIYIPYTIYNIHPYTHNIHINLFYLTLLFPSCLAVARKSNKGRAAAAPKLEAFQPVLPVQL